MNSIIGPIKKSILLKIVEHGMLPNPMMKFVTVDTVKATMLLML